MTTDTPTYEKSTGMDCRVFAEATHEMDESRWQHLRNEGIGGSDSGAILGQNPWKTPREVWQEKVDNVVTDLDSEVVYWGNRLEDIVAKEFEERNDGFKVRRRHAILQHPQLDFMLANIDRNLIGPDGEWGLLEIKTTNRNMMDKWENGIPPWVRSQVMHYLAVTGLSYAYIAVLFGGQYYRQYYVERDEELIESIINIEKRFWDRVENENPPPIDGSKAAEKWLKENFPESSGEEIQLSKEALNWIEQYNEAHEEQKDAKERKKLAKNKLREMLGDAEVGHVEDKTVKWSDYSRTYFNKSALEEEHPDIYERFTEERSYRRFSIKG